MSCFGYPPTGAAQTLLDKLLPSATFLRKNDGGDFMFRARGNTTLFSVSPSIQPGIGRWIDDGKAQHHLRQQSKQDAERRSQVIVEETTGKVVRETYFDPRIAAIVVDFEGGTSFAFFLGGFTVAASHAPKGKESK